MKTVNKKCIVIGAGVGGLAAAIRLRLKGFEVSVFESAAKAGGKLNQRQWNGFRFDTGPSLFTLPGLVDELFAEAGKNPRDYFHYHRLEVVTKYFYENSEAISAYGNPEKFADELALKAGVPKEKTMSFLKKQADYYNHVGRIFLEKPIYNWSLLADFKLLKSILSVTHFHLFRTMHRENELHLKAPKAVQLFDRFGTYNGSNPYKMPGIYNMIAHLEHNLGAYLPEGGMYQIADALYKLATELGVQFHFSHYVNRILLKNGRATGVVVNELEYLADVIVSNMDVQFTYNKLLPEIKAPELYLKQPKTTSALIFYWAMNQTFPDLEVHNIFFSNSYRQEFETLFEKKELFHDPTVYVYVSSKVVKADAPAGKENWFVMVNVPHLQKHHQWDELKKTGRELILKKLNSIMGENPEPSILHEMCWTPAGIQADTYSYLGALYGNNSNQLFAPFLRHPNFWKVKDLYFCGGTAYPGGGIPLCLLSAKITTDLITG